MKILALDYDGVLVDSEKETFAVAYNIYQKLYGFKKLNKELLRNENFSRIDNELKGIEKEFTRLRPFCSVVCNFSSVMSSLDNGVKISSKEELEEYMKEVPEEVGFRKKFHNERERLQKEDFDAFLKLSPPHNSVINDVKKLLPLFDKVYIMTGNRKDLVRKVLLKYGLKIPLENMFDAEFIEYKKGKSKKVMIAHILEETKAKPKDIVFVEDQYEYLKSVLGTGVKVFMADWGFDNEEHRKKAQKEGIEVVGKDNFFNTVKSYVENVL